MQMVDAFKFIMDFWFMLLFMLMLFLSAFMIYSYVSIGCVVRSLYWIVVGLIFTFLLFGKMVTVFT